MGASPPLVADALFLWNSLIGIVGY